MPILRQRSTHSTPVLFLGEHGSSDEGYSLLVILILILQPSPIRFVDGSLLMHTIRGCAADQSDQYGDLNTPLAKQGFASGSVNFTGWPGLVFRKAAR